MGSDERGARHDDVEIPPTVARLDATVALLRLLAEGTEPDPEVRLTDLLARRAEVEAEILLTRAGRSTLLSEAEAADLHRYVVTATETLLDALRTAEPGSVRAVADALLAPARRAEIGVLLARVGLSGAHHDWLAAAQPDPAGYGDGPPPQRDAVPSGPLEDLDCRPAVGAEPPPPSSAAEPHVDHVRQALRHRREHSLADLLEEHPLQGGLAELVGWLALTDDAVDVLAVDVLADDDTDRIGWTGADGRTRVATVPRVRFRRAGGRSATPTRETHR